MGDASRQVDMFSTEELPPPPAAPAKAAVDPPASHVEAMRSPRPGHEAAIVGMFRSLAEYADAHYKRFHVIVADDCWIGEYFRWAGDALLAMLSGEAGRLDCGTLDGQIRDLIDRGGSPDAIRTALDAVSPQPARKQAEPSQRHRRAFNAARKREAAPETPDHTRRLTERQRELLTHLRVESNVAVYGRDEIIPDWAALKQVMTILGGKWRTKKGFVFPEESDARELIRLALETGEVLDPDKAGYFPTPKPLVERMIELAQIPEDARVLEPSAGTGNIAAAVRTAHPSVELVCCEILSKNAEALRSKGFDVVQGDFLQQEFSPLFSSVVSNPPFAKQQDITHVTHALKFLRPEGRLVSIMSAGAMYRENRRTVEFRQLVEARGGWFEENPDGSFLESGTGVRTVTVVIPGEGV